MSKEEEYEKLVKIEVSCPNCGGYVFFPVDWIQCGIVRHGTKKGGFKEPLDPHASEQTCMQELQENSGCGKPFRVVQENQQWIAIPCDFI